MHCSKITSQLITKQYFLFSTHFRFPNLGENSFQNDFVQNTAALYVDKSKYAAQIMIDSENLMYFNRPKGFGKTTLLSLLRYLYIFGVENSDLKARFPLLDVLNVCLFMYDHQQFERWRILKENQLKTQVIPIWLDFRKGLDNFNQDYQFRNYLTELFILNIQSLSQEINKPGVKTFLTDILSKNKENKQDWEQIIDSLEDISKENAKLSILINELPDKQIMTKAKDSFLNNLETDLQEFFKKLKSLTAKKSLLERIVMFGEGESSMKNINIFSGPNAFKNFSLTPAYENAFGFTKEELLFGDPRIKQTIIRILKKHDVIKGDYEIEEKLDKFMKKMFRECKLFNFKDIDNRFNENLYSDVIHPITFVNHMHSLDRVEKGKLNPNEIKHFYDPRLFLRMESGKLVIVNCQPEMRSFLENVKWVKNFKIKN